MKEETKKLKALQTLKEQGMLTPELEEELKHLMQVEDNLKLEEKNEADSLSREAESVLALIDKQHLFISKECKYCHGIFASNYANVAYCTDRCRRLKLEEQGISWNRKKSPEERWGYRGDNKNPFPAPLVVPSEVLKIAVHHPAIQQFLNETLMELVEASEPAPDSSDLQPTSPSNQD